MEVLGVALVLAESVLGPPALAVPTPARNILNARFALTTVHRTDCVVQLPLSHYKHQEPGIKPGSCRLNLFA